MKRLEIVIKETNTVKLTVAKERITIKHNDKIDYSEVINFLKKVSEEIGDVKYTVRGKYNLDKNGICMSGYNYKKYFSNESSKV